MTIVFNNTTKEQIMKLFSHDLISFKHNVKKEEVKPNIVVLNDAIEAKVPVNYIEIFKESSYGLSEFANRVHLGHNLSCCAYPSKGEVPVTLTKEELEQRAVELTELLGKLEYKFKRLKNYVRATENIKSIPVDSMKFKGRSL